MIHFYKRLQSSVMNTNFYSQNYTTSLPNGDFFSGGGEMEPVKAESRGGRKERGNMCKNIVPVQIHTLTSYRKDDGPLMVHGIEVSMVKLVAQLRQMDTANLPQSLSYTLDDDTGRVEAIQYLTEEEDVSLPANNTMIQVIGSLKIGPDHNMLKVFQLRQTLTRAEADAHLLEIALLPVRMRRMTTFHNSNVFQAPGGRGGHNFGYRRDNLTSTQQGFQRFPGKMSEQGSQRFPGNHPTAATQQSFPVFRAQPFTPQLQRFPGHQQNLQRFPGHQQNHQRFHGQQIAYQQNSQRFPGHQTAYQQTLHRFPGHQASPPPQDGYTNYSTPDMDRILSCIKSSQSSLGISRQELYNALRSQMVQRKVDEGLDLLASEGYIYTTMDHDHFRHIEA